MYQNKLPIYEIMSGASIAFGSLMLIIPGFLTDLMGFLFLIPFTRKIIFNVTINKTKIKNEGKEKKIIDGEIIEKEKDEL